MYVAAIDNKENLSFARCVLPGTVLCKNENDKKLIKKFIISQNLQ